MYLIEKHLKNVRFSYDFSTKTLSLFQGNYADALDYSRVEMFSLMRFIIRIAQKGKPKINKTESYLKSFYKGEIYDKKD